MASYLFQRISKWYIHCSFYIFMHALNTGWWDITLTCNIPLKSSQNTQKEAKFENHFEKERSQLFTENSWNFYHLQVKSNLYHIWYLDISSNAAMRDKQVLRGPEMDSGKHCASCPLPTTLWQQEVRGKTGAHTAFKKILPFKKTIKHSKSNTNTQIKEVLIQWIWRRII